MSHAVQPYNSINRVLGNQQYNRAAVGVKNDITDGDILGSLFGLANQLMGEILRSSHNFGGIPPFMGLDANSPHPKVFGVSAMNVTQITRGPDGRPHVIQAHNERRMGPGGVWQTKKALRDADRGIEKVQIGYFSGDQGEIIERRLDRGTGQYREEVQRHSIPPNDHNFSRQWRTPSQPPVAQPSPLSFQQYPYYSQYQQQQHSYYTPKQHPPPSPYAQQQPSAPSPYAQQPPSAPPPYPQPPLSVPPPYPQQPLSAHSPYPPKPQQPVPAPPPYSKKPQQVPPVYPYI